MSRVIVVITVRKKKTFKYILYVNIMYLFLYIFVARLDQAS